MANRPGWRWWSRRGRHAVRFVLEERLAVPPAMAVTELYLALIKFDRFEWAVEKATELGVTRIVPVETQRSDKGLFEAAKKRVERWRKIAREASEQSRRLREPEVADAVKLARLGPVEVDRRVLLDETEDAPPLLRCLGDGEVGSVALLVGPEGGWADGERAALAENGWVGASLGPSILRAETAVCAALAVVIAQRISAK